MKMVILRWIEWDGLRRRIISNIQLYFLRRVIFPRDALLMINLVYRKDMKRLVGEEMR
jgi:hypothetical protein